MAADYVQLPPNSTGKKILTHVHTVDGTEVSIPANIIVGCNDPEYAMYIDQYGAVYTRTAEGTPAIDTFSRSKMSQSHIVGVYEFSNDGYDDLFCKTEENGATVTHDPNVSAKILATTTALNSHACTMTNRYHYYQAGTSALIQIGASVSAGNITGNTMRWGAYDEHNGFAFSIVNGVFGLFYRNSLSGSAIDTFIPQSEFNVDKLDGSGLSEFVLDPTEAITYFGNYNWPVGIIKLGIYLGNERIVCHKIYMSGTAYPLVQTSSLPVKFANFNTQLTTSGTNLRIFSATVLAEGDPEYTFWRYSGQGCTAKTVSTDTVLFSVKPKLLLDNGNPNHIMSIPEHMEIYTDQPIKIYVYWHDTTVGLLTGATWAIDNYSTTLCDDAATVFNDTHDNAWLTMSFFCDAGIQSLDLSKYFELNDEALCTVATETDALILTFVATKLGATDATVTIDLNSRELW